MVRILLSILCPLLFFVYATYSQTPDSVSISKTYDTISRAQIVHLDSSTIQKYLQSGNNKSFLLEGSKHIVYDVQQMHSSHRNFAILFLLLLLLVSLTYVKVAFGRDIEELLQSFINSNIAQQIFRGQSTEISLSTFLLQINFIIALSLYVQFVMASYFHIPSLENFSSVLSLIFLFTFFYLTKIILLKIIGVVFEVNEECREYIFNFSTVCKMVGLTLIPALFIFHATNEKFFKPIFFITILISVAFAAIFIWRGLSTGYKLLYSSVYHFFIYVCVVEISPIFLLFKLLTKTIH